MATLLDDPPTPRTTDNVPAQRLRTTMAAMRLSFTWFGTRKTLSPEQKAELDKFVARKLEIRKELRQVRRQLDAEIESLGTRLKVVNIVLMPLLVTLAALAFAWWRNQRRRQAQGARA